MSLSDEAIVAYEKPLVGAGLSAGTLPELVSSESIVILHFLRHLGCMYCKHSVEQLRTFVQSNMRFPRIYFVHQSPVKEADTFFETYFPGAAHISDPGLGLYKLFEINKMEPAAWLNPGMWTKGAMAFLAGHRQLAIKGDVNILSGTFLFHNGKLRWQHRAAFAGDDPDWRRFAS